MKKIYSFHLIFLTITFFLLYNCKKNIDTSVPANNNSISELKINQQLSDSIHNSKVDPKIRLEKADKLIFLAKSAKNDSILFDAYLKKMTLLKDLKMDDSSSKINHEIIKWANTIPDKKYLGEAYFNFGKDFYQKYQNDSAYYYFNNSKNEFLKINNKEGIAKNSINIAMILNDVSSYFESQNSSLEALNVIKDDPKHPYLTPIYNNLAVSSGSLLNYNEELYWYEKALELTDDPYYIASIKHNQGVALTLLKKYDKAISVLSSIVNTPIFYKDNGLKARVIDNLAYAKWKKSPNTDVLESYNEALNIYKEENDFFGMSTTYDHLIDYYKDINPKKSLEYANLKYSITKNSNNTEGRLNALKSIITLNPNPRNITDFITLSDSLQHINSNSKYEFAKLKYDVDANRNRVTSLSLENAEKELRLERAKIYGIIILAILVIAILSFTLYSYRIKQKRKEEKLKTIYETEVKLSQKLHDELANDLFSTITLVDSIKFDNADLKHKLIHNLDHIYSQTRKISRQNNIIDTENFKQELDFMLGSYKSEEINVLSKGIDLIGWENIEIQLKIVIYRILMELMTNMKKHSDCNIVMLNFIQEEKNLQIKYADNGSIAMDQPKFNKNGLKNVENRIKSIDGSIIFDCSKGFKAFINIPTTKK
ncbi:tetratricopeptide repeat-containing sensor histidine kinase [Faecalibacter rhinopitheci]|uniref:Tetratricopeptide repeat protein n=1 Tax=Faecalibacter rhinopitheci TaxID=2779678 RepID=A0A8J7FU57_9FLAO|nr:tetratricopeptide repeat-containing sensor histidine kinase [Faecalibacter rhinopitheci]MBF0597852.1 hypothetical protein [Faecalibacter rhinopitheci]